MEGEDSFKAFIRGKLQETIAEISSYQQDIENAEREIKELKSSHLDHNEVFELFENVGKVIRLLDKEVQQAL